MFFFNFSGFHNWHFRPGLQTFLQGRARNSLPGPIWDREHSPIPIGGLADTQSLVLLNVKQWDLFKLSSLKNVKFEQLNIPLGHHGKLIGVKGAQVDSIRSKLHCCTVLKAITRSSIPKSHTKYDVQQIYSPSSDRWDRGSVTSGHQNCECCTTCRSVSTTNEEWTHDHGW